MYQPDPAFEPEIIVDNDGYVLVKFPNKPPGYQIYSVQTLSDPPEHLHDRFHYEVVLHHIAPLGDPAEPHLTCFWTHDGERPLTVWAVDGADGVVKGKKDLSMPVKDYKD